MIIENYETTICTRVKKFKIIFRRITFFERKKKKFILARFTELLSPVSVNTRVNID